MKEKRRPYKDGPVISVDVSKSSVTYQGWVSFRDPYCKPRKAKMSRSGLGEIVALREEIAAKTGTMPPVVYEDTGVYSRPLSAFLRESGIPAARVSPLQSAKVRKSDDKPVKTDSRDCKTIAECYYTKDKVRVAEDHSGSDQAELSRELALCRVELQRAKCRFRKSLDHVWPLWDREFKDPYRDGPWQTVRSYRHPSALLRAREPSVQRKISEAGISARRAATMAARAKSYASEAVSGCLESSPAVDGLMDAMSDVERLTERARSLQSRLESLLSKADLEVIRSIDGIGGATSLVMLAEIGSADRFHGEKAIVSFAGFDSIVNESGTSLTGLHLPTSKKGNKRLRWAATMAVRAMVINKLNNGITRFRSRLINENHLSKEAATVAAASKLLRVVISMLKSGQKFNR